MKTQMVLRALILTATAGAAAFGLRGLAPARTLTSPLDEVPPLEYFASAKSFSEVEPARARLQALSRRYLYAVQVRQAVALRGHRASEVGGVSAGAACVSQTVQELEEATRGFRGTGEEPVLTHGLLICLASEHRYERWIDVYLDLLYRHPTEEVVGVLANAAVTAGRATGRLEEVLDGFRHVSSIPFDFEAKHRVQAALAGLWCGCGRSAAGKRRVSQTATADALTADYDRRHGPWSAP